LEASGQDLNCWDQFCLQGEAQQGCCRSQKPKHENHLGARIDAQKTKWVRPKETLAVQCDANEKDKHHDGDDAKPVIVSPEKELLN